MVLVSVFEKILQKLLTFLPAVKFLKDSYQLFVTSTAIASTHRFILRSTI